METIRQTVVIDSPAHGVYEAFTDSDTHAEFTGAEAAIEPVPGGNYSAYNDDLQGEFTTLVPDEVIVMKWRSSMPGWPEDHYAVASIELFQSGEGTTVELEITDVPGEVVDAINDGWHRFYWEPLADSLRW